MENRSFVIFNVIEIDKINFDEVLESSKDTLRKSVNEEKTFVKWEGDIPNCVLNLETKYGIYDYNEMLIILQTQEWINNMQSNLI